MTLAGLPFLLAALYLTFLFAFVYTILVSNFGKGTIWHTCRRWGKLLLLLVILGVIVQVLTAAG